MSTHSAVIEKLEDGSYRGIYVHSDGYLEHMGPVLLEHYQDAAAASALIDLGNCSFVGGGLNEVVAYSRDRGEEYSDNAPTCETNLSVLISEIGGYYAYVFEDGEWTIRVHGHVDSLADQVAGLEDD